MKWATECKCRLIPHADAFTNADRLRAVEAFDQHPMCMIESLPEGQLAEQRSFAHVDAKGILICSFRGVGHDACEVRNIKQDRDLASARLILDLPVERAASGDSPGRAFDEYRSLNKDGLKICLAYGS